jgi:hypothetical protein
MGGFWIWRRTGQGQKTLGDYRSGSGERLKTRKQTSSVSMAADRSGMPHEVLSVSFLLGSSSPW